MQGKVKNASGLTAGGQGEGARINSDAITPVDSSQLGGMLSANRVHKVLIGALQATKPAACTSLGMGRPQIAANSTQDCLAVSLVPSVEGADAMPKRGPRDAIDGARRGGKESR